jgi:FKBP12-rapamycin complex-associated protein
MKAGVNATRFQTAPDRPKDTLSRHLENLCRPGHKADGERHLLDYVESEARDLSTEAFGRFMNDIYNRLAIMLAKG